MNLKDIAKRLRSQDNRCTALPMFCVQRKQREYGYDPQWTDDVVWVEHESGDYDVCEEYLRKNKHNLGETRIFVESFHRCPEMIAIREFLLSLGDKGNKNEMS